MYQCNVLAAIIVTLNFCNFGSALDTPARQNQINLFCSRLIRIFDYVLDTLARQKQINLFCSRLIRIFAYQHSL